MRKKQDKPPLYPQKLHVYYSNGFEATNDIHIGYNATSASPESFATLKRARKVAVYVLAEVLEVKAYPTVTKGVTNETED
jgi:hypothetical protein